MTAPWDMGSTVPVGGPQSMRSGGHTGIFRSHLRTKLKLFFEWGIRFDHPLSAEVHELRPVCYASRAELMAAIQLKYPYTQIETPAPEMTPLEVHLQEQAKQPDGLITKTDK
jgi:hypothetical protein